MQSTNDPRLLIGVGSASEVEKVTIHWPSGAVSSLEHPTLRTTYEVVEPFENDGKSVVTTLARSITESP